MKYLLLFFLLFTTRLFAADPLVKSPDGQVRITWTQTADGSMSYNIQYHGRNIARGSTRMQLANMAWMGAQAPFMSTTAQVRETYTMQVGKASAHKNHYNELRMLFRPATADSVVLWSRAYNDGVAFRWGVYKSGLLQVKAEETFFEPAASELYIQQWDKAYEGFYQPRRLDTITATKPLLFPFLFQPAAGTWCLVSEAGAFGQYPGVQVKPVKSVSGSALQTVLPQSDFASQDSVITPWRFFVTGTLANVVETALPFNLNPPPASIDWSWVKPGVATFPWWGDHFASSDIEVLKRYVDLADSLGWEWIEFDVALVGTDLHTSKLWESTHWLKDLTAYAHSKGVKVYGWDELKALDTPEKRAHVYGMYRELGIDGIKIDFLDSDAAQVMAFRKVALEDAARYQLMVSFHGETAPRGQQRTYPNLMTHEAVRGAEYYTFPGYPAPTPQHNTTLPFTRNVIGSMDYTPATFTAKDRKTTYAHELALPFVFESGWNVLADVPEAYLQSPARAALERVEAAWDETRLLDGFPGAFAVLARRKGNKWVVAGINSDTARTIRLNLRKLGIGTATADLYADDVEGKKVLFSKADIRKGVIELPMMANGGFVLLLP